MAIKDRVRRILNSSGFDVRRPPAVLLDRPGSHLHIGLDHLIAQMIARQPDPFFVQIGAFDGQTGDQLHQHIVEGRWRGVLVEPQPKAFAALRGTYAGHNQLTLRQVAVADKREMRKLFAVREDASTPDWAGQVATFDRSRLSDFEGRIDEHDVECIPMSELLTDVERVDLLQVDVEGFDAEIIRMFPFERHQPNVVRFENWCLSRADHNAAVTRLVEFGYSVAPTGNDTIAWHD